MKHLYIFKRMLVTSCMIYGMMLAGCHSNDYDTSMDEPGTTVSPAHGDVLVPDTATMPTETNMHDSNNIMHAKDSVLATQPKAID